MRANSRLYLYPGHSRVHYKHNARPRGPSRAAPNFETSPESFDAAKHPAHAGDDLATILFQDDAVASTLAMHKAWAHNWAQWNQYCSNAFWLARPLYVLPLEFMQHYFSFIFGNPQCVSEPVGQKRIAQRQPNLRSDGPSGRVDGDGQCEEIQKAMDVAIGATTEMWFEVTHEETNARGKLDPRGAALVAAA